MASFKKLTKGWQAQVAVKGQREARTFGTKAEAVAWAGERETELRKATSTGIVAGKTCGDAFDRYLREVSPTKKGGRHEALRLAAVGREVVDGVAIRDIKLADMTPDILGKWKNSRMSGENAVKGSTVNRDLNLLSHVFTMARKQWQWIAKSPTTDVARPKPTASRDRIPTADEIERICFALGFDGEPTRTKSQAVAVAYLFAMETAMRAGEICQLRADWITGSVAHLPAEANKNGFKRDVPLSKEARRLLALLPPADGPMFGISSASLDALFRKAKNAALIEGTTFHDSRHAAITMLAKKLNVLELARMVGHRDIRQLQVYFNADAKDIVGKLD